MEPSIRSAFLLFAILATVFATSHNNTIVTQLQAAPSPSMGASNVSGLSGTPAQARAQALASYAKLPLSFEPNLGQAEPSVRFLAHWSNYELSLRPAEAVLSLPESKSKIKRQKAKIPPKLRMNLIGANATGNFESADPLPGKSNYFIGDDPAKWRSNIPTYRRVIEHGVYPGIDLVYYGSQGQLEYDFVIAPGVDPSTIRLAFQGARKLSLDKPGDLVMRFGKKDVRMRKPHVYQEREGHREEISASYILTASGEVTFEVGGYNRSQPLIIDPTLVYSTLLGGVGPLPIAGIAVDKTGAAYVTGPTDSPGFPTTAGAFQTAPAGTHFQAFVAKLSPDGSSLVYSTLLGGHGTGQGDLGAAIAVDSDGNAYVTGITTSTDFPHTAGAFQTSPRPGANVHAFVTKIDPTGSKLIYSTYLSGSNMDLGFAIAIDGTGHAYVTGPTQSADFPVTAGAFQTRFAGGNPLFLFPRDAFVTKLNANGTGLEYSTFLGGSGDECAFGIAVDSSGAAYVTGFTTSADFPVTKGAFRTAFTGAHSAFVTKLDPGGSSLVYSTFLGGTSVGSAIALDAAGNAAVTGFAGAADFTTTPGALQPIFNGANGYVLTLDASGSKPIFSTFLGGLGAANPRAIAVDSGGGVWLGGLTCSFDFPTVNPIQATPGGKCDAFLSKLDASGSKLLFSTYLGGSEFDTGNAIAVDSAGAAYIAGSTAATTASMPPPTIFFPTTPGAFQRNFQFGPSGFTTAGFVAKIALAAEQLKIGALIAAGGPPPNLTPSAAIDPNMPKEAHLPLGDVVRIGLFDLNNNPLTSTYTLGTPSFVSPIEPKALFPTVVAIQYGTGTPATEAAFQAVHLGSVPVTITPANSRVSVKVTVFVDKPLRLGAVDPILGCNSGNRTMTQDDLDFYHNELDALIVDAAHKRGIPPQFIKGQIEKESCFRRLAWRYEPISPYGDLGIISGDGTFGPKDQNGNPITSKLAGTADLRTQLPYRHFTLETTPDAVDQKIILLGDQILEAADINARDVLFVTIDPKTGQIVDDPSTLKTAQVRHLQSPDIAHADAHVSALNIYRTNDIGNPPVVSQNWSLNNPDNAAEVDADPRILDFTAQTTLASSYGLLQILYNTAVQTMQWPGVGGSQNPRFLFDTDSNRALGGGSLTLGTQFLVKRYRQANQTINMVNPRFSTREAFDSSFKNAYARYNQMKSYAADVLNRALNYPPVSSRGIF